VNFAEEAANILHGFLKMIFELKTKSLVFIFRIQRNLITNERTGKEIGNNRNSASREKKYYGLVMTIGGEEVTIKIEESSNVLSAIHRADRTVRHTSKRTYD